MSNQKQKGKYNSANWILYMLIWRVSEASETLLGVNIGNQR